MEVADFEDISSQEFGNTFMIKAVSGSLDEEVQETLVDRFYDEQIWQVLIAEGRGSQNDRLNREALLRKKDTLIREIDDPDNWRSYVRIQKYLSWEVTENNNYFLLTIEIKIVDTITY